MAKIDKHGQIIRTNFPSANTDPQRAYPNPQPIYTPPVPQRTPVVDEDKRNLFNGITLTASLFIYSVVGGILNPILNLGLDPLLGFVVGGLFGLLVTAIYNFAVAKEAEGDAKDFLFSLGIPAVVLIAIGGFVIVIALVVGFFIVAALLGGG